MTILLTDTFSPNSLGLHPGEVERLIIEALTEREFFTALTSVERVISTIGHPAMATYLTELLNRSVPWNPVNTRFSRLSDVLYIVELKDRLPLGEEPDLERQAEKTFYRIKIISTPLVQLGQGPRI